MNAQLISKIVVSSAALVSLSFIPSCAQLDPEYAEYQRQKKASTNAYGVPSATNNSYSVPGANGETNAPYQPIPGVNNTPPVVENIPTPSQATQSYSPLPPATVAPPAASTHTVMKGDTIWGLTRKYGVSSDALREANNLSSDTIWVGQKLIIPAR